MDEVRKFMTTPAELADAVKTRRRELRLTQAAVANTAGVSRQFVSMVEHGHPTAELGKVLAVLDAVKIHALAVPEPAYKPVDMTKFDLNRHIANYVAKGWT